MTTLPNNWPNIVDSKSQLTNDDQRFPLTGTIDQAGNDIQRIKQIGIDDIIFGSIGEDLDKVMDITKELSRFAR